MANTLTAPLNAAAAQAAAVASAPLTVPVRIRDMDLAAALSRLFPVIEAAADGGNISGRHIPLNGAGYAALVGRMTADSVALALAYAVIHFHNGTKSLPDLAEAPNGKGKATLPAWVGAVIHAQYDGIKRAGGMDADRLRLEALALADRIKGAAVPVTKKASVPASAPVLAPAPDLAPARREVLRTAAPVALLSGAMEGEALAGILAGAFTAAHYEQEASAARRAVEAAPVVIPAPVVQHLSPKVGNDYPADALAFVQSVGEDKARAFLEALAATLAPAKPAAKPRRKVREAVALAA